MALEIQKWINADEEVNLKIIFEYELQTVKPEELGSWFRKELNRRQNEECNAEGDAGWDGSAHN